MGDSNIPQWYLNAPGSSDFLYAAGAAPAQKMRAAVDSATAKTRTDLATSLDTNLVRHTRAFTDTLDDRLGKRFAEARRETLDMTIEQVSPAEKEVYKRDNGTWRAFVLMKVSPARAGEALLTRLEAHETLHSRFRESAAYQELTAGTKEMNTHTQER